MANRDMSSAVQDEIVKTSIASFELFELELDEGTERATNAPFQIEYNSNTYTALGELIGISEVEESTTMQINEVTVTLTGIDPNKNFYTALLGEDYIDRPMRIYRTLYNNGIIGTFTLFSGRLTNVVANSSESIGTIEVTAASNFVDFERIAGRKTNDAEQQFHYSGDTFFEFAPEVLKDLVWKP